MFDFDLFFIRIHEFDQFQYFNIGLEGMHEWFM